MSLGNYFPTWLNKWIFENGQLERLYLSSPVQSIIAEVVHPTNQNSNALDSIDLNAAILLSFLK